MVNGNFVPLLVVATLTSLAVSSATASLAMPRVDASVHRTLRKQGHVNLIVTVKDDPKTTVARIQEAAFPSRAARIEHMIDQLETHAKQSQAAVASLLAHESSNADYTKAKSFWISNQMFIQGASPSLVDKLSALPSVLEVREEQVLPLLPPTVSVPERGDSRNVSHVVAESTEWGVQRVNAPAVWNKGFDGRGVVVATIDSGVRGSHEALRGNFRADHGWFDPEKNAEEPYDANGHGTHTMGTIAGANGVGVAPGAAWITCKGCREDSCSESDLLACAQFITCPTDASGNNKDCSKAPHLVSNSWGGGQGQSFYQNAVNTWQKAGIIPIFANGNSGPSCGTANSPADYTNVIAVGATTIDDGLAEFSSKGPSVNGDLKPDISAPGKDVRSTWFDDDSSYNTISGTSMAAPHVSGCVALLLSAKPGLQFNDIRQLLIGSTDKNLAATGQTCGGTADGQFPNNQYGHGRVNVLSALSGANPGPGPAPSPSRRPTPKPSTSKPKPTPTKPVRCEGLDQYACEQNSKCLWFGDFYGCITL